MALRKSDLEIGQTHEAVVVEDLRRTQIVQYAGASGDYNPVHTDELFATKVAGYPTVFAHGIDNACKAGDTQQAVALCPGFLSAADEAIAKLRQRIGKQCSQAVKRQNVA